MHRYSVFILLFCLLMACDNVKETEQQYEKDAEEFFNTVDSAADRNPYAGINAWQGNLDGKYPVLMWYKNIDGVLQGSLFYTDQESAPAIRIVGRETEDGFHELIEHMPDGKITGHWKLRPTRNSVEGDWSSPSNGKTYSASLMDIDTAVEVNDISKGTDLSGNYVYYFDDANGPAGHLSVKQIGKKVIVGFDNVSGGPAHDLATISNDTLTLSGNTAKHISSEYGECQFSIRFFDGFAVVDYIDDNADCGFGHNAFVNGVYLKK